MTNTQACPLCDTLATFVQINQERKHFKCPTCSEFWIDEQVEPYVSGLPLKHRSGLSSSAKGAATGETFVTRKPSDEEFKAQSKPELMMITGLVSR